MLAEVRVERYELLGELATGGMATVYLGRQHGPFGFNRTVAIKSMHPQFAKDDAFRAMFLDEASITARIKHPNVIPTLDVVFAANKLLLVMEFVDGASMSTLLKSARDRRQPLSPAVCVALVYDVLSGLHAAHELVDDDGRPLGVVHRDVSPHNVHVGTDGLARVLDFGIAKAAGRRHQTRTGEVKGKLAYMAPEQLFGENVDRRADIYAAGVTLWEALAGRRLFDAQNEGALVMQVTEGRIEPPSFYAEEQIPEALDRVILKALAKTPEERWPTAEDMARALAEALAPAPRSAVKAAVIAHGGEQANARGRMKSGMTPTPGMLEPDARAVLDVLTQQVHVARTEPPPSPKAHPLQTAAGIALLVVIALMGVAATVFVVTKTYRPKLVGVVKSAEPTSAGSDAFPAPPPPPSPSASSSITTADPVPVPAPNGSSSVAVISPQPKPHGTKKTAPKPTGDPSTKTVTTARPDCTPPYTVDAEGHRHYKAECVTPP
jgi:eukaryotic-like serine/threonine-protein kinase